MKPLLFLSLLGLAGCVSLRTANEMAERRYLQGRLESYDEAIPIAEDCLEALKESRGILWPILKGKLPSVTTEYHPVEPIFTPNEHGL